jgi:hypothetical protein
LDFRLDASLSKNQWLGEASAVRRFNTRDVLVVAIMQAAVIAVGVLLVGRWDKRFLDSGIQAPFPVAEFADGHTIDQIIDEWTRPKVVASVL